MGYISLPSKLNAIYCNRYNKLLLCNSENGDIAWWNENNSNRVFACFFKERKPVSFQKNKKNRMKKKQKNRWGVFFKKRFFFSILIVLQSFLWFSLDRTIWNKSRHYQFDWVCATHLEYKSLVLKNVRIACIWIRKFSFWQQTKFLKFKSMQHVLADLQ